MEPSGRKRWSLLLMTILVEGNLGVLAWLLGWLLDQPPLSGWRWDSRDAFLGLVAGLPLLLMLVVFLRWPIGPLKRIEQFSRTVVGPMFGSSSVLELLLICALAGMGEEMFFRGFLQGFLGRHLGLWPALALASIIFGLVHLITPTYALLATLMGAYFGWLWLWTGTLLVPVIAHAVYDFVALLVLTRGGADKVSGEWVGIGRS